MLSTPQRDRVAELVSRLAAGDASALVPFIAEFGGCLAGTVRRQLRSLHRDDVGRDRAQLDELVQEAALVICDHAASWSPDGALPWTWAERAIRQRVVSYLGHPSVEFEPDRHDSALPAPAWSGASLDAPVGPGDELADLARRFPEIGLLDEAIGIVGSARNRAVHIQYQVQKAMGDPSPAHTVAAEFDLTPDNVRQIDRRIRVRLRKLVDTVPRYKPLADLDWLAA